jgi:capsular polysaccharide biosynthesis protein
VYDSRLYSKRQSKRQIAPIGSELDSATYLKSTEDENILSLRHILQAALNRLWLIIFTVVLSVGAVVGFSLLQTPMYQSSIKILVGQEGGITQNLQFAQSLQQLTKTMSEGVNSRPIAEATIQQLGLDMSPDDLLSRLQVEESTGSQFIRVSYLDPSPERAQQITNALGDAFSEEITQANPNATGLSATVWERAETPGTLASPNAVRLGFIALVVGLVLGIGLAALLEYLDNRWRSSEEVAQISGVATLGAIPSIPNSNTKEG